MDGTSVAIYYAENIAGGANTVTVSDTLAGGTLRFAIFEYAGVATANSLDGVRVRRGPARHPTAGPATTTSNGNLVLGVLSTANPRTLTAGSGYVVQERCRRRRLEVVLSKTGGKVRPARCRLVGR